MNFDIPTLMAAGALMTGMASLLLGLSWLADREARTLLWWSAANLLTGLGIVFLLAAGRGPTAGQTIGSALVLLGASFIWSATRVFQERRPLLLVMITGLVAFFAAGIVTPSWAPLLQATVSLGLSAAFFGAAAVELLQRPRAHLRTRWPLVGFLVVHTIVFAIGGAEAALDVFPASGIVTFGIWFGVIHFEQLIFSLASSIFAVAIVRERSELRHRIAAHVDVLTGVASRRAFFESAAAALRHCEEEDSPFSLVIFDLDRFKQVNDTFGHAAGDQVLQLFCRTAVARIRRGDIIGRLGGEEFAVAMPGASPEAAYVVADRIRQAFATADLKFNGRAVATMASGGVAAAHPLSTLDELIEQADAALYRAKSLGRDRIEMTNRPQESDDSAAVIRVA